MSQYRQPTQGLPVLGQSYPGIGHMLQRVKKYNEGYEIMNYYQVNISILLNNTLFFKPDNYIKMNR